MPFSGRPADSPGDNLAGHPVDCLSQLIGDRMFTYASKTYFGEPADTVATISHEILVTDKGL